MHAAIVRASGLGADRVLWKFQQANQPPLPYIALSVSALSNPGQDGLQATTDPLLGQPGARPPGEEIMLEILGMRECVLGLEIFTESVADDDDALALADRVGTALILPTVRELLSAARIAPLDVGDPQFVPEIVSVKFRGRALLDIRCLVPAAPLFEFVGYIARVLGTLETTGGGVPGTNARSFLAP